MARATAIAIEHLEDPGLGQGPDAQANKREAFRAVERAADRYDTAWRRAAAPSATLTARDSEAGRRCKLTASEKPCMHVRC
jgi:hypothetical protein